MTTPTSPPRAPLRPQSGRQVAVVMLVSLGAMVALAAVGVVVAAATTLDGEHALVLGVLLGSVGAWAGLWFTLSRASAWGWRELGFVRPQRSLWHLLWQVPVAVLLGGIGAGLLSGLLGLSEGGSSADQDLVDAAAVGPWSLAVVGICGVLVLPAAEEVLFRRVLLDWLLTRLRPGLAVAVTAVSFAALHIAPAAMVYVVFLGLFTCLLRLWYGSLWAPLALHAANNGLVGVIAATAL